MSFTYKPVPISRGQIGLIYVLARKLGYETPEIIDDAEKLLNCKVDDLNDLTGHQAHKLIEYLKEESGEE